MDNINLSEVYKEAVLVDEVANNEVPDLTDEEIKAVIARRNANRQPTIMETPDEIIISGVDNGLLIENMKKAPDESPIKVGVEGRIQENLTSYLNEMDEEIKAKEEKLHEAMEEQRQKQEEEKEEDDSNMEDFDQEQFDKVTVLLDKIGVGTVEFTPEERLKMEKAKVIRLEEIETVSLESIKVKRSSNVNIKKILAKKNTRNTTSIVLPASGYTAVLSGCSLFEISNFTIDKDNLVENILSKWNLIYTKIVDSSIKFKNFDHFLKSTALTDYSILVYGILCATFPDEDEIELRCVDKNCNGTTDFNGNKRVEYPYKYSIKNLMRAERMSDGLFKKVRDAIESSYVEEDAIKCHENSDAVICKRIKLPDSEIIMELGTETAHDFIYNAARAFTNLDEDDDTYKDSLTTATAVRKCFIPDEDDGTYIEVEDKLEIAKIIYQLNSIDIKVIMKVTESLNIDTIDFGFAEIKCPYCGKVTPFLSIDITEILFLRCRQATQND